MALDGVDGYIVLGERAEIFPELPTAMSVSVWLKMSDALPGSGDGIFTVDGGSGFGTGFDVFWSTALDEPALAFYPPGDGSVVRATPTERTGWTHVVAVYDPDASAGQEASLYLDGELAAMGEAAGRAPLLPDGELWIGKYDNDGLLSEGSFDEVAIWSSALAADEVAALYNAGSPADALTDGGAYASSGSLAGYWRMGDDDDGAGSSVKDLTGNSDAALVGGASFSSDAP